MIIEGAVEGSNGAAATVSFLGSNFNETGSENLAKFSLIRSALRHSTAKSSSAAVTVRTGARILPGGSALIPGFPAQQAPPVAQANADPPQRSDVCRDGAPSSQRQRKRFDRNWRLPEECWLKRDIPDGRS